jgi:hypothetical protein
MRQMHVYSRLKARLDPRLSDSSRYLTAATLAGTFTTLLIHPIFTGAALQPHSIRSG